jgi:hypothetical protein
MKDIIGYHNKHLTGKISNYTAFFEKCGYLLSAMKTNISIGKIREIYELYMYML